MGLTDWLRLWKTAAPRKPGVRYSPEPGPIRQNTIVSSPPALSSVLGKVQRVLGGGPGARWQLLGLRARPPALPTEALCRRRTRSRTTTSTPGRSARKALQPALPAMDSRQAAWMDDITLRRLVCRWKEEDGWDGAPGHPRWPSHLSAARARGACDSALFRELGHREALAHLPCLHMCSQAHTHAHTCIHTLICSHTCSHMLTHALTRVHTCSNMLTGSYTCSHT